MKTKLLFLCSSLFLLSSCIIIRPGEVGVKQKLGRLDGKIMEEGPHMYNPLTTVILVAPIRTENIELSIMLPSKEGLNVGAEISILYRIEKDKVPELIKTLGLDYEQIITNVFRSASADVCAGFYAKDMHSGNREAIEQEIRTKMNKNLEDKGILTEAVLMKSIKLPDGLYASIEERLKAEQDAMRMSFIIEQEKLEAQRKIIEAEGIRDAQKILSEGLTDEILELKKIEAMLELSKSNNAKVIVTDTEKAPVLIQE